jgi:predicted aspartyl protease
MYKLEFDTLQSYESSPNIEVTLTVRSSEKSYNFRAVVDTGADYCVFQPDIAEVLGIELAAGSEISIGNAAGSTFKAYGHEVELEYCGIRFSTMVYFADVPQFRRNLLGRVGWLDQFRIAIVHHDSSLYVRHYNSQ